MKKTLLAAVAGGFALFIWGILSWMVLPIHDSTLLPIAEEDSVVAVLKGTLTEEGVYWFPAMPEGGSPDAYVEKYRRGPIGMIMYDPEGGDPIMVSQMIVGLLINIISAFLVAWLLSRSTAISGGFLERVTYCGMLGIFAALSTYFIGWNWMNVPLGYTTAMAVDLVLGWLLAGTAIAGIMKPAADTASP